MVSREFNDAPPTHATRSRGREHIVKVRALWLCLISICAAGCVKFIDTRFGLIVHHTDRNREWAYDRESHMGTLIRALDEAPIRTVVDLRDWKVVCPFQK